MESGAEGDQRQDLDGLLISAIARFGSGNAQGWEHKHVKFERREDTEELFALLTVGANTVPRVAFSECFFTGIPDDFFSRIVSEAMTGTSPEHFVPLIQFEFAEGKLVPEALRASDQWKSVAGKQVLEEEIGHPTSETKFKVFISCNGSAHEKFNVFKMAKSDANGGFGKKAGSLSEKGRDLVKSAKSAIRSVLPRGRQSRGKQEGNSGEGELSSGHQSSTGGEEEDQSPTAVDPKGPIWKKAARETASQATERNARLSVQETRSEVREHFQRSKSTEVP